MHIVKIVGLKTRLLLLCLLKPKLIVFYLMLFVFIPVIILLISNVNFDGETSRYNIKFRP